MERDKAEGQGWNYLTGYGYRVVSVNDRLTTPQIKFPAMIRMSSARFAICAPPNYPLGPNRIGAIGASAGKHLYCPWRPAPPHSSRR